MTQEKELDQPLAHLVAKHKERRLEQAEQQESELLTDEDFIAEDAGDSVFLRYITEVKFNPEHYRTNGKFLIRLAARRARRQHLLTMAEHGHILSLIEKPVRLHKETKQPFDIWQAFEQEVFSQMESEGGVVKVFDVEWFKDNWSKTIKIINDLLLLAI
jgi:hypothetical protein